MAGPANKFNAENFEQHYQAFFSIVDEALGINSAAHSLGTTAVGPEPAHLSLDECEKQLAEILDETPPQHRDPVVISQNARRMGANLLPRFI